jgi:hypothetical protein
MTNLILAIHIFGAVFMLFVASSSLLKLWAGKLQKVSGYAIVLAWGMVFEVVSGSVMALQMGASVGSFCAKIGLYFAAWLAVETILFVYDKKNNATFPGKAVSFAVAPALVSFAATFVYLV